MKIKELFDVSGKVALITGSTGGIGSAMAKALCDNDAIVVLNGRDRKKLMEQFEQLSGLDFKVHAYQFDITNSTQTVKAIAQIKEAVGDIDILINNAGITVRNKLEEFNDEDWDRIIAVNLTGAYKIAKAVVPGMIARRSGKIINIGSIQCELGRPSITPYAASKGAIKMLTKGMAVEWAKYNIQINGIGPGYFKSEMTKPLYENVEFDRWLCSRTPSGRWGNMDELLGALMLLASPASNYMNGQMIYVDGGLLASV
jgi:gluconate 5-dehydrogenase